MPLPLAITALQARPNLLLLANELLQPCPIPFRIQNELGVELSRSRFERGDLQFECPDLRLIASLLARGFLALLALSRTGAGRVAIVHVDDRRCRDARV